jgi:hypothetical protein
MQIMTYRGTVKNGIVVLEAGVELPEGQPVEVVTLPETAAATSDLPGFGLWRDRTELESAAEESLRLRRETERLERRVQREHSAAGETRRVKGA